MRVGHAITGVTAAEILHLSRQPVEIIEPVDRKAQCL
jgi:hypothetical protein